MRLTPPRERQCRAVVMLAVAAALCLVAIGEPSRAAANPTPAEIRALWVLRSSLSSPASIAALVKSARDHGFNTLLVQVRGRGDAYYTSTLEPRAADLQRQPASFDPLEILLTSARAAGLGVHAWLNLNLVSSAVHLPLARTHIVHRHPDWLMVPRDLAQELARVDHASPAYVGRLARWTRTRTTDVEGLYVSPIAPAAVDHLEAVVRDLVRRYPLDGVHFDYARYPTSRFDYSRTAIREFRASVRPTLAAAVRRSLDQRESASVLAYPDGLPAEWKAFRIARMTTLMTRLRAAVKAERPSALVTLAARPNLQDAYDHRLQDWRTWISTGIVDAICPMAYTTDAAQFAQQIAAARDAAGGQAVWAGIGAYRLTAGQTVENIRTARRLGAAGFVLFSYDSLKDQAPVDYLAIVGRSAFPRATSEGSR